MSFPVTMRPEKKKKSVFTAGASRRVSASRSGARMPSVHAPAVRPACRPVSWRCGCCSPSWRCGCWCVRTGDVDALREGGREAEEASAHETGGGEGARGEARTKQRSGHRGDVCGSLMIKEEKGGELGRWMPEFGVTHSHGGSGHVSYINFHFE